MRFGLAWLAAALQRVRDGVKSPATRLAAAVIVPETTQQEGSKMQNRPVRQCPGHDNKRDRPVTTVLRDVSDQGVLSTARLFFLSFADPGSAAWVDAFGRAHAMFGHRPAPTETTRCVLTLIQELRISRKRCFRFSNPYCEGCAQRITPEERHLINVVQAVRDRNFAKARLCALLLCEGEPVERLLAAADALALQLERV